MNKNIVSIILIIIAGGLYFTLTSPMYKEAQKVKVTNDQLLSDLNNADEIIKMREDVTRQYAGLPEGDKDKLDKMIPSAVDNIRLVIDLNNLALQNHFTISDVRATVPTNSAQSITPGGSRPAQSAPTPIAPGSYSASSISEPVLDKVDVTFKATATYGQFLNFLHDVEMSLRIMDLTRLSIKAADTGAYEFNVQFQTYWLRQ